MKRFKDKVVIVTGGASGQGAVHAQKFLNEGAKVVITDISVDKGEALADELGENIKFIKHNVASEKDWIHVVEETEKSFGPINILVNNAGITAGKKAYEMTEEEYRRVIDINQIGVFLGMKNVFPSMKKNKNSSIINVASIASYGASPETMAYTSSKYAVLGMTKAAAIDMAAFGIRVNSVHPGTIQTPMIEHPSVQEAVKIVEEKTPLKRIGLPEEVSSAILFLASDESSFLTGSELVIDGGVTAAL